MPTKPLVEIVEVSGGGECMVAIGRMVIMKPMLRPTAVGLVNSGLREAVKKVVTDTQEACCRVMCSYCASGYAVNMLEWPGPMEWAHDQPGEKSVRCDASAIRTMMKEE